MLMSVIVANDGSGGSTSGSVDEATAASTPPPPPPPPKFHEGKGAAPQPLPPLVSPKPRKVNGGTGAAVSDAGPAAGRSDSSGGPRRNNSKQRRGRKPQQQQHSERKGGQAEGKECGTGAGDGQRGKNVTSPSSTSGQQPPQQHKEQEMRRLGKRGMWRDALEVLGSIPEPSQREYVAAIAACDFAGEPRQAFRVHALMVEQGLEATPVRGGAQAAGMGGRRLDVSR